MACGSSDGTLTIESLLHGLAVGTLGHSGHPARETPRCNRSVAILLCPIQGDTYVVDHCVPAVTVDFSDNGVGVVTRHPLECAAIAIAVETNQQEQGPSRYALASGTIRHNTSIGGGFWHVGIQISGLIGKDHGCDNQKRFRIMASHILPPTNY